VLSRRQFLAGAATAGIIAAADTSAFASPRWGRFIVDAQTHLWLANTPDRPWFGKEAQLPDPFTIERLLPIIDEAGVDRVVLVPPTLEGERIDYVQEAVKRCPGRFGIMARIAIDKPERAARLPQWRDQPGVLGIRLNYGTPWLTNGSAEWFWPAAEKANLPVMLLTNGQNALIGPIAERFPGLTIIIDHMGISGAFMKSTPNWTDEIDNVVAGLAKYPNVSVKLSSIPLFSSEPYPWRDTIPHIHRLYDAFGPLRCHWGTDQTNTFAKATYTQRITQFTEEIPFFSESDKDWIMGRSLMARLRWP
jgi:predicted TIM-barrel fold metal-dependent hydrolase